MIFTRRKAFSKGIPWKPEEETIILEHLKNGRLDLKSFRSFFPNRTLPAIRAKIRRLRIKHDLFGTSYRKEKSDFTTQIAQLIKPNVVFDAYAGVGHQTLRWIEVAKTVFASEKMKSKKNSFEETMKQNNFLKSEEQLYGVWNKYTKKEKSIYFFQGDAIEAVSYIKIEKKKVDIVDLDTCGSTLPSLPIFLGILKPKHLVITHGEFHSLRFGREDVLRRLLAHKDLNQANLPMSVKQLAVELDKAVKLYAIRSHNETKDSFWLELNNEIWLGQKNNGMLRRHYRVTKPRATADCLNSILK